MTSHINDIAYVQDYAAAPVAAALWRAGLVRTIVAACHLPVAFR